MNKKTLITIILIVGILIAFGIWFYFSNNSFNNTDYQASRTSSNNTNNIDSTPDINNTNNSENNSNNNVNVDTSNIDANQTEVTQGITESETPPITEEQIATFTTKIYSKDSARQNNISITCNTLNETVVKNGETFSFCDTVGQATTSKGYQKADIFDNNRKKEKRIRWW